MEVKQETNLWKENPISSYLRNIALFKGIENPLGLKGMPRDGGIVESSGCYYNQKYDTVFALEDVLDENGEVLAAGYFSATLKRYGWRCVSRGAIQEQSAPFIMLDNGSFTSSILVDEGEMGISLETSISGTRKVSGDNYDVTTGCDNFYGAKNQQFSISTTDKYKLKNGIYLIHSSDYNAGFEVYNVPRGFNIAEGISELTPEIFMNFRESAPKTDAERLAYYKKHKN